MRYILVAIMLFSINLNAKSHKKFWDNKQIQMDVSIKNSKPDGTAKFYHKNAQLYSQMEYKNGLVSSKEVKLFDTKGKLIFTNHYKSSKPDGKYKTFLFQNGMEPLFDGSYKNGKFSGVEKIYYKDATLRSLTTFKEAKRDGVEKKYDYKGKLNLQTPYKNDKKHGLEVGYTSNGKSETNYKNGVKNGSSKTYYKNGKVENLTTYKNDKKNGVSKEYNSDGTVAWEGSFKDGKLLK